MSLTLEQKNKMINDCELLKMKINDMAFHLDVTSYPKLGSLAHM